MKRTQSMLSKIRRGIKTRKNQRTKTLMYSNRMKRFVKNNPRVMLTAYKLIKEIHAQKDKTLKSEPNLGLKVTPIHVYSHRNVFNRGLYKVEIGTKTFFVKNSTFIFSALQKGTWERSQKAIEALGGKIGSTKIRLIHPQLIYKNFLVSDYYNGGLISVAEMNFETRKKFDKKITILNQKLTEMGAMDCSPANIFFDPKKDTLYIFDLVSKPEYELMLTMKKY
jgi:hypothetical protein